MKTNEKNDSLRDMMCALKIAIEDSIISLKKSGFPQTSALMNQIKIKIDGVFWPTFVDYIPIYECISNEYMTFNSFLSSKDMLIAQKTMKKYQELSEIINKSSPAVQNFEDDYFHKIGSFLNKSLKKIDILGKKLQTFLNEYPRLSKQSSMNFLLDIITSVHESTVKPMLELIRYYVLSRRSDLKKDVKKIAQNFVAIHESFNTKNQGKIVHISDITFIRNAKSHDDIELYEDYCVFFNNEDENLKITLTFDELLELIKGSLRKTALFTSIVFIEQIQITSETIMQTIASTHHSEEFSKS